MAMADNLEMMLRTPLRSRNQEYCTPAIGKRQATLSSNLFATPTKRGVPATPQSMFGRKRYDTTPNTMPFKKLRHSPPLKHQMTRTPGHTLKQGSSTPSKFCIYEDDNQDALEIEPSEKCPWGDIVKVEPLQGAQSDLKLVDDFVFEEPQRKKLKAVKLGPLIPDLSSDVMFELEPLPPIPDPCEADEICPWADIDENPLDCSVDRLSLDSSTLSNLDVTKERLSEISIRCFNESFEELEISTLSELPDIPSTRDLDLELQELLELSFETFTL